MLEYIAELHYARLRQETRLSTATHFRDVSWWVRPEWGRWGWIGVCSFWIWTWRVRPTFKEVVLLPFRHYYDPDLTDTD